MSAPSRRLAPSDDARDCYEAALRSARHGTHSGWTLRHRDGSIAPLPLRDWCGGTIAGDAALLSRCTGPTLDVGCGPGRITEALTLRRIPALGIDIAAEAVRQCLDRGAAALHRDIFDPIPGEGRWRHVILADGNLGIGGQPRRLLRRIRQLIGAGGSVICETLPPGAPLRRHTLRLEQGDRCSDWFPWAQGGADAIAQLGPTVGLHLSYVWTGAGRWFIEFESDVNRQQHRDDSNSSWS